MSRTDATIVRIGLIGAGRIGRIHARNLAHRIPGAQLMSIADTNMAAARECADEVGAAAAHSDYRRLLNDTAIDAVAICSSTPTHAQIIAEASEAGKHIFCEKPIDLDLARIDRALAAVRHAGVKLQVGFNRRFDPSFGRIREIVAAGEIGTPHLVRITSRDPAPPPIEYIRTSGGMFLDMTIHDFDMARFLVGREVEQVFATGAVLIDQDIGKAGDIDTAVVSLRFAGGCLGSIDNSRQAVYGYDQRVEVFGSAGSASAENSFANTVSVSGREFVSRDLPLKFFIERYDNAYLAEMDAFIESVASDLPTPVGGQDGRAPVVIALAARLSLDEGRPVSVGEIH